MMRKNLLFFSVACAAIFSTACDDSPTTQPAPAASIAIGEVTVGKREASFTLTPENAVSYGYACLLRDAVPAETDFVPVEEGREGRFTVRNLLPGTAYTITARAVNADGVGCEAVTRDFETARMPSLSVGAIVAGADAAEVEVAAADAERLCWACAAAGEAEPVEFAEADAAAERIVVEGLRPASDYVFYAYAADADSRGETVTKAFRTAAEPARDLSAAGRANCYVVTGPGVYSFAATVKGNGVSSNLDEASKVFDGTIALGDGFMADWLWASAEGLVKDVALDAAAGVVRFEASAAKGNAVIALFHGDRIVWSWHIWLTDDPGANPIAGSDAAYQFMDRNLGATSTAVDDVASFGFFYQWGRKDPFVSASAPVNEAGAIPDGDPFHTAIEGVSVVNPARGVSWSLIANDDASIAAGASVDYAAAHPMTFITYGNQVGSSGVGAWVNDDNVQYAELWGYDFQEKTNRKTMFDPCPPGYKVPTWYQEAMADASKTTMEVVGDYQSRTYNGGYWPAQGYRMRDGRLSNVGRYGYYWSACAFNHGYPAQNFKGYMLYWYSRMVSTNSVQDEAIGGCVRCMKE